MEYRTAQPLAETRSLAETQPLGTQQLTEPDPPGGQDGQPAPGRPAPGWPAPGPAGLRQHQRQRPNPNPYPNVRPAAPAGKRKHRVRRLLARIFKLALAMVVITELAAVSFIWFAPPRTAFMLQTGGPIAYQYVSLNHISRYVMPRPSPTKTNSWERVSARSPSMNSGTEPSPTCRARMTRAVPRSRNSS